MTTLNFTYEEILHKFNMFVSGFLSDEPGAERKEVLPKLWLVNVPEKDFSVTIKCELVGSFHGVEQWAAVVTDSEGDEQHFHLFENEIQEWAEEQRKLKGIE